MFDNTSDNFEHEANYKVLADISDNDVVQMMNDTSSLIAKHRVDSLSAATIAAYNSNTLSNGVEFWKLMGRNYNNSGIFETSASMQQYIAQSAGRETWFSNVIQGKGYEWDWMTSQRNDVTKIFNTYDAGDVANRVASDVTEHNWITGKNLEYQMKAYAGKTNPHLKNTPKDMTVVTNAEKVDVVRTNGYKNVEEFQDAETIRKIRDGRLEQVKRGQADTSYNITNVAGMMAKATVIGSVVGVTCEAIASYKAWKNGQLSDEEYLSEILKAGGSAGVTSGLTAGVMIPVSAAVTAAGASVWLTVPVAFVFGSVINSVVAPCFGLGEYREILSEAKYYQNLNNIYRDLLDSMRTLEGKYLEFIRLEFIPRMKMQNAIHNELERQHMELIKDLKEQLKRLKRAL